MCGAYSGRGAYFIQVARGAALIRGRRLFEVRRLIEEARYTLLIFLKSADRVRTFMLIMGVARILDLFTSAEWDSQYGQKLNLDRN